jgi:hypothetical protein
MNELYQEVAWKDIKGFEGHYQVSSDGRIRSLDRIVITKRGFPKPYRGQELVQSINNGYPQLTLHLSGKSKPRMVHSLVAYAFLGERPEGMEINHINGIKTDNRVSNLEYLTPLENTRHAINMGLVVRKKGEESSNNKLTEKEVLVVRQLLAQKNSDASIARSFGVHYSTIRAIRVRKSWGHLA